MFILYHDAKVHKKAHIYNTIAHFLFYPHAKPPNYALNQTICYTLSQITTQTLSQPRKQMYLCGMISFSFDIIKAYYAKGLITAECAKVCHDSDLCADLVQEVTLILMEKPSELIEGLHERGEMLYFIYKIAKNQAQSETSPFYTTYKKFNSKSVNIDETKI